MASQAPRRRDIQRSRESQRSQPQHQEPPQSPLSAASFDSSNSSLILNNPQTTSSPSTQAQGPPTSLPREDIPKCWICQQDATDDTPESSAWRRPCPCSLTAHDDCLLVWITSQEAPKPGEIATTAKIVCPVCKAPIKIERPQDLIVTMAEIIQRIAKSMIIPAGLSAVFGCFYSGFLMYGLNSMDLVFGRADTQRMLQRSALDLRAGYLVENSAYLKVLKSLSYYSCQLGDPFIPLIPGWKVCIGVPMIGPVLILSRTRVAEHLFAVLPPIVSLPILCLFPMLMCSNSSSLSTTCKVNN